MRIDVPDAEGAGAALAAAASVLHGAETDDHLEIVLPGRVLEGVTLQFGSPYDARRVHVTVRGRDTTLRRCRLHLVGATITVEDLVIEGAPAAGEALKLLVEGALRLDRVAIRGLAGSAPTIGTRTRSGLRLEALGPRSVAVLSEVVAEGNRGPLFVLTGQPRARFREVAVLGGRFTDNDAPEVLLGPVDTMRVEGTVRVGAGAFARATSARTLILSEP